MKDRIIVLMRSFVQEYVITALLKRWEGLDGGNTGIQMSLLRRSDRL